MGGKEAQKMVQTNLVVVVVGVVSRVVDVVVDVVGGFSKCAVLWCGGFG